MIWSAEYSMSAFILSVVKTMIKITDNALAGRLTLSIEIFPLFCVHMAPIYLIIVRMRSLVKYEQQPEEQRILVEFGQIYVVSYDKSGWLSRLCFQWQQVHHSICFIDSSLLKRVLFIKLPQNSSFGRAHTPPAWPTTPSLPWNKWTRAESGVFMQNWTLALALAWTFTRSEFGWNKCSRTGGEDIVGRYVGDARVEEWGD